MVKIAFLIAGFLLVSVNCYPAKDQRDSSEVEFVPLERQFPFRPAFIDSDEDDFSDPFATRFTQYFADLFKRLTSQMNNLLNQIHGVNGTDVVFGDLGKGNTTSVTKIIDGHKVVINETRYEKEGENGGSFVKIVKINVVPESSETTEPDTEPVVSSKAPATRDRESLEDSVENEIPKTSEDGNFDIETFDLLEPNNRPNREEIEYINIPANLPQPIRDLSNDINVNSYMADAGVPPNPDAEFIDGVDAELAYKDLRNYKYETLRNK